MKGIYGMGFRTKYGISRGFGVRNGEYDDMLFVEFRREPATENTGETMASKLNKRWRAILKDGKEVPKTKKELSSKTGDQWNKATVKMLIDALNRIANQVEF